MPVFLSFLHLAIALASVIYIMKNGYDRYWIYLIFVFPVVGILAFCIVVVFPDLVRTRKGHKLKVIVNNSLRPNASVNSAMRQFEMNPCVANRIQLADSLMSQQRASEAIEHYQQCLMGVDQYNPDIMLKLATAQLSLNQALACIATLDKLRAENPSYNSPFGHLIYARALADNNEKARAIEEFEALITYYSGYEAKVRYAEYLQKIGDEQKAQALLEDVLKLSKHSERFVREMNADWISLAKKLLRNKA